MPHRKNGGGDANCATDHESGGGGLLAYRHANVGSDNPPDAHQPENHHPINGRQLVDEFAGQNWLAGEQSSATRNQNTSNNNCNHATIPPIMFPGFVEGTGSDSNDISASSNTDGPSNRPTPNSSTASDNRQSATGPGQMANSSSRRSFDTSPIGSHQSLGPQAEIDATTAAFFQMGGGGTGMTPDQGFTLPDNWAGQNDMTPVADGVLQHLLDVRMDLGWDSNT